MISLTRYALVLTTLVFVSLHVEGIAQEKKEVISFVGQGTEDIKVIDQDGNVEAADPETLTNITIAPNWTVLPREEYVEDYESPENEGQPSTSREFMPKSSEEELAQEVRIAKMLKARQKHITGRPVFANRPPRRR
jgi:hypothetical protein